MAFDPHYNNVSLLLHCDGANGSTVFTDNSPTPKTVTAFGGAAITTTQSKFGGASLSLDGSGDYLSVPGSASFVFGTGDFCIELWIKTTSATERMLVDTYKTATRTWQFSIKDGKLSWYDSWFSSYSLSGSISVNDNNWHHVAVTRASGVLRFFVDGVADGSVAWNINCDNSTSVLGIGAQVESRNAAYDFVGCIDDIRITKGVARYTSAFTPPANQLPDSATETEAAAVRAAAPSLLAASSVVASFGETSYAHASCPALLSQAQAQLKVIAPAWIAAPSPLGDVRISAAVSVLAQASISAPAVLGSCSVVAAALPVAYASAPAVLGSCSVVAAALPVAYASAPAVLGEPQAIAFTTASAHASSPSVLGVPAVVAAVDTSVTTTLGTVTQFGVPVATTVCRATEGIQLIPLIPPLIAYQDPVFTTVVAQQEQPIPAPVFGTPSVSFATSHPAASLEANPVFGVPVVRAVHEAASLEPVVFGSGDMPTFSAQASSLLGQTVFGVPVVGTVHTLGDWYVGIRMGTLAAVTTGSFPILDSIESTQFGTPNVGGTVHRAMPLHLMPQFGPITISRGSMQC